jgi:putative DNA primase/helicase
VRRLADTKKITVEEAEKQLPRRTLADLDKSTQELDLNDTVEIAGEIIPVSELLERGEELNGKAMPDPIEGSEYGKTTAMFYFNNGQSPCIHSFAHGRKTVYVLKQHLSTQREPEQPKSQLAESHVADLTKALDPEGFPHKKLQQNGTIKLLPTIDNHADLCKGYGISLGYNVMKKEPVIIIPGFSGSIENYFSNTIETICSLAALNGMDTRQVPKYLNVLADRNPINPIAEWITSVPWDGADRVEAISDTLVVHEEFPIAFKGKLIKKFLTSAVAAATLPSGFESRGILTIQGPQGIGKTSWARNLVPPGLLRDQYVLTGHHLDASSKDSVVAAITHWFVEIGEVDSSLKKNVALLKGFITQKHDSVRLWYGRAISKFQRRTVFIATVNDPNFLVDQTGNSRFWTLPVTKIDYNHKIEMQQLYRQLHDEIQQGAEWWLNSEEEAQLEELNQVHRAVNAVEERVMMAMNPNLPSKRWAAKKPIEVLLAIGFRNPTNRQCKDCADVLRREYGSPKKIQGAYKYRIPLDHSRIPNN